MGAADDFKYADELWLQYGVDAGVVDAEPERRAALGFANKHFGRIFLCDYLWSQQGRQVIVNEDELGLKCNRTAWLDLTLGRYKSGDIDLPKDLSEDYSRHVRALTRVYREDKWGAPYGVYVKKENEPDHFAHSDV